MNFSATPAAVSTGATRTETWVVAMDTPKRTQTEKIKIYVKLAREHSRNAHEDGLKFPVDKGMSAEKKAEAFCKAYEAQKKNKPYTVKCIPGTDVVTIRAHKGFKITKILPEDKSPNNTKTNQPNFKAFVSVSTTVPS